LPGRTEKFLIHEIIYTPIGFNKEHYLKYLPPYSSELNSIDHLLKDIRMNVTHNNLFESIAEIVQAISKYFMIIQRSFAKIKRLCTYILYYNSLQAKRL